MRTSRRRSELSVLRPPVAAGPQGGHALLDAAAGVLAFAVMSDSGLEHFRGSYKNRAMFVAPTISAATLAAACGLLGGGRVRRGVFAAAVAAGLIGTGFHVYNIAKREGGFRWLNLFYGAPLGAPGTIAMAGLYGLAAEPWEGSGLVAQAIRRLRRGPLLAWSAVVGLIGTIAEVGLFHYRGNFQNPFMYAPVTLPPLATGALAAATLWPATQVRRLAGLLLGLTGAAGVAGMAFHAYGVQRCMGGWANWRQNAIDGPPLPAPLGFLGMALAGLAALARMEPAG